MQGADTSMAVFEFERGGIGQMFSSWGIRRAESKIDFRLYCQDTQLIFESGYDGHIGLYMLEKSGTRKAVELDGPDRDIQDFGGTKNFVRQYTRFHESVVDDVDPEPGMRTARDSMEAILEAVEAAGENRFALWPDRPVTYPPFRPIDRDAGY